MRTFCYPFLVMFAITGCGAAAVEPDATTASGTWVAVDQVPGSHERWTLTISGAAVQGTGDWSREACCGGVVTLTGTTVHDSLHLNVAYRQTLPTEIPGSDPVRLEAVLDTPTDLVVTVRGASGGSPTHFRRETQP